MSGIALIGYPEESPVEDTVAEAIALARRVNARVASRLRSWHRPPLLPTTRKTLDDHTCLRLSPGELAGVTLA